MSELYDNLLKATDNTSDITTEKYGVITKINGALVSVLEEDTELEHSNVPILNQIYLETGDKVVIGFVDNSIYNPVIVGNLTRGIRLSTDDIIEPSSLNNLGLQANSSQHQINLAIDSKINSVGCSVDWSDIENKPSDYPPLTHTHTVSDVTDFPTLSTVATTGDYDDLLDKPSIPSSSSDLSDGSDLVKKSSTSGLLKNDGSVDTNSYLTSLSLSNYVQKSSTTGLLKNDGTVDTTQYLSSLPTHNHDDRYYTESEVDTALNGKQATLISGTNIKTINNTSLLGSGNISIQGGGTVTVDDSLSTTSTNPVQNKVITGALNGKANSSHTHLSSDVTDLIDVIYPVGSIYMSVNSVNPSTLFGGTWEQIKDTFLLATGDTYANGSTGGEATHTLTENEMPSHTHIQDSHNHTQNPHSHTIGSLKRYVVNGNAAAAVGDGYGNSNNYKTGNTTATNKEATATNQNTGGGQAHNNMPPYLTVYMWKRTA